ncbi:MAG TPA: hypothetical protein VHT02_04000 [Methylocella sp.]|jgi:hypothetical protein|nr:hypothetical protein [Methylocella sp.]
MGEIIALSLKFGIEAIPAILSKWGIFAAFFAFFAYMPLGHTTIGVLLIVTGIFYPDIPTDDVKHEIKVGTLVVRGNARTALMGIGTLIVIASFTEAIVR